MLVPSVTHVPGLTCESTSVLSNAVLVFARAVVGTERAQSASAAIPRISDACFIAAQVGVGVMMNEQSVG
jgi:hypothetical protein